MGDRRLLLVHAHPDDETIGNGATMATYVEQGVDVTLVTCTLGEEGEVLDPAYVHLAANDGDQLGGYRIAELARACEALGVTDHRFLGGAGRWRDSGMMGLPENENPRCFWQASPDDTTPEMVAIVREVRPQVLVCYDENGGYGHPDHIQAHRVAMAGFAAASDPAYRPDLGEPWQVSKVYWAALPKSVLAEGIKHMQQEGSPFQGVDSVDDLPMGTPDELVTTRFDGSAALPKKIEAMRAHSTQIATDGPFFALADGIGQMSFGHEYYQLVHGELGERPDGRYEADLFAGL